jgi:unsaturated rhamnogalacturonyl hydrolase
MNIISRILIIAIAISLSNGIISQEKPLSQQVAATVLKIWPDTVPIGSQTKWSYDMGVVLKGFEGIWMNTGDISYFNSIQKKIDFFVKDDGSIKNYELDEYNLDHVNNGKLVLLLYRVLGREKYKKAADLLRRPIENASTYKRRRLLA